MNIEQDQIRVKGYLAKRNGSRNGKNYFYYYVQLKFTNEEGQSKTETHSIGQITKKGEAQIEMEKLVEAKRKELELYRSFKNNEKIIFVESFKEWLLSKKDSVEENTFDGYVTRAKGIIKYFEQLTEAREVDAIYLDELRPLDLEDFYEFSLRYGKTGIKSGAGTGLSRETVLSYAGLLHNYFKDMAARGYIKCNICEGIHVPRVKTNNVKEKQYLNKKQIKELMEVANAFPDKRIIPIIKFCVTYGCRRSEVLGLKWNAIDFDDETFEIRHTVVRGKKIYCKENTKSESSHRSYPLTAYVKNELLMIKETQIRNGYYREDGYVFWDYEKGCVYSPDYMSKLFKKLVKACESIPNDFHFHDMRKTCTTLLFESGKWSLDDIQMWIGHENKMMSEYKTLLGHYLTVTMKWKKGKVPLIEKLFQGIF